MEAIPLANTQGHNVADRGFGLASNRHLYEWITDHRVLYEAYQNVRKEMDPKVRDIRPYQIEQERTDLSVFDDLERKLEARAAILSSQEMSMRRDTYTEEFSHEDMYNRTT